MDLNSITKEKLESLSIQELEGLNNECKKVIQAISAKKTLINSEIEKKEAQAEAKRNLSTKSDAQKKALLQELSGDKTITQEAVNPGK